MTETKIHVFIGAINITDASIVFLLYVDLLFFKKNGSILY